MTAELAFELDVDDELAAGGDESFEDVVEHVGGDEA